MFADRILRNSLMLSIVVHTIVIFNARPFKIFHNIQTNPRKLEVTYYRKVGNILPKAFISPKEKIASSVRKEFSNVAEPALADRQREPFKKRIKSANEIRKPFTPSTEKIKFSKAAIEQDKMLIFHDSKDLSGNPSYLKYHNIVRSKIEQTANSNKPYIFRIGEVNLMFTILNSGDLKNVNLVNNGSVTDPVLRQCALDSVYAASPFPPFTGDMKEDHLTLQVTISFVN
ncbi:MAG: hypothetical protein JSW18_05100 [Candidatus Omnitrophota bacterium]|nr:MAG: hypothetical protein JSW18_05100 [Candidatus Omnitrophota bacterium]